MPPHVVEVPEAYSTMLADCETLEQLEAHVKSYEQYALDAIQVVRQMTKNDFLEWQEGLKKERRGIFAGETFAKKYGAVLIPQPMMTIALIANQYQVPFYVAYRRLQEVRPDLLEVQ